MVSGDWRVGGKGSPQARGKAVMGVEMGFREMLCVRRGSMDGMSVREMREGGLSEEGVLRAEARARLFGMMLGCCSGGLDPERVPNEPAASSELKSTGIDGLSVGSG